jgi:alkanesulfonate monooxygenase SsuD/methylene tetrahydromethanopterin reductase-like flavin-dependent oxidoreductase (luciferase family)
MIRRLWTEPVVSFEGHYYQLNEAYCEPKPIQQPHPPFVIGGDGEQTLRVVARYANIWDCSVASPEEYRYKSQVLDSYCAAIGRDPATIERSRHISVDASDLNAALLETRTFIEAGATHIIYHVPVPDPLGILCRLAEEVAEPLRAKYEEANNQA